MRYWRDRDISDRLISDRANRKTQRETPQLPDAIGFQWAPPEHYED